MKYSATALLATLVLTGGVMAQSLKVGDKAPSLSVDEWIKGSEVESFEKGKVYVVEFWATWCGPCITSIPHLAEIQTTHKGDGVTVIGVAGYERQGRDHLVDFVTDSENGEAMKYTVAYDADESMSKAWMDAAGKTGIPTSFLVDQNGKIAYIGHPSHLDKPLKLALAKRGAYVEKKPEAPEKLAVGSKAPKLAIETWVKGEPVTGFEKGRVYVVEFWATWCGPCIAGMPHVSKVQKEYGERVTIIGVNIWDDPKNVAGFMKDRGSKKSGDDLMQYRVAIETKDDKNDVRNGVMAKTWMKAAGRNGIPSAFIVDQKGNIAWIGHPSQMDAPLKKVVAGEWEADAAALYDEYKRLFADGNYKKAYAIGHKLVEGSLADDAMELNELAWRIVDPEKTPETQDLDLALKAAKRANKLYDGKDAATLDTLATVYYDKGNLKAALKYQRKAVDYAQGMSFEGQLAERLKQYEAEMKKRGG